MTVEDPYLVKLVRDRIGEKVDCFGTHVEYRPVEDPETVVALLRRKLVEEAAEYLAEPSASELADVLEVAEAIACHDPKCGGWDHVKRAQLNKRADRGSFLDGVGMYASGGGG